MDVYSSNITRAAALTSQCCSPVTADLLDGLTLHIHYCMQHSSVAIAVNTGPVSPLNSHYSYNRFCIVSVVC
jgi:hypothetical protein